MRFIIDFNPKLPAAKQKILESTKADAKDWTGLH